jgi:23S rRNA (cytosine1962-C5)-methyltransferase
VTDLREISLSPDLKTRLSQGHPWVYRNQLPPTLNIPSGTWIKLRSGNFQAYGLYDARSQIAVRVFSQKQVPDEVWVRERVLQAWELREPIRKKQKTNTYRWLFGEADGLPGVTVDLYGQYAVIQTYAESLAAVRDQVVESLREITSLKGVLERRRHNENDEESPTKTQLIAGTAPPRNLIVEEHGLRFRANLIEGQKTGLFLDHRENRRFLQDWCEGKTVLNCFSYTGAFSVYATRGKAARVTSVDIALPASAEAMQNFELNGLDPAGHEFISEDCFETLTRFAAEGRKFDLIILDPPSFARSVKNVHAALRGYQKLNRLALKCVAENGLLATASCTAYVSPDMFREMLSQAAAAEHMRLQIIHDAGHALDHPVPAHFPEGRYLKFMLARAIQAN